MTSRRKSKRLEVLQEPQGDLRRSPRLRERYSRERSEGPTLLTVTHSATLRPGLSGYMRQKELEEQQNASILNESGQSVPAHFDLGDDTESRHSGGNREETDALSGQMYGSPDPRHLYGLDESEDEEIGPQTVRRRSTPSTPSSGGGGRQGVVGGVVGAVISLLFRLGSLLYLTTTAILCLDVIILHRCYMMFTAVTCWSSHAASKPWLRFWILPAVLCSLIAVLIGGGLVPATHPESQFNFTSADLSRFRSELSDSIKRTLSTDLRHQLEEHIDKVVKEWVESRLIMERDITNSEIQKLRIAEEVKVAGLVSDMEALETRLTEMWNETQSTFITEAILLQILQTQIQQQLNTAKQEWLKLVPQEVSPVTTSVDELRADLSAKDEHILEKLSALEKLVEENNNTITMSLLQLILELQTASASISSLASEAETHSTQLSALKTEVAQLRSVGEGERREVVERLEALEAASLSREDMVKVFEQEMERSVGTNTSVLWKWLSQELERADQDRKVSTAGLTRKEVEELVKTALERYSADRIAKFDFALENSGGLVVSSSETYPPALETFSLMGVPIWTVPSSPKAIIQPHVHPGDCWAMDGTKGHALIRLKEAAVVTGVTLEHIPKDLTPSGSLSSAPREFQILGKNETGPVTEGDLLGQFTYTIAGSPIQEFPVQDDGKAYTHILFEFLSNHGNPHYTCVYRVRVHGRPATTNS